MCIGKLRDIISSINSICYLKCDVFLKRLINYLSPYSRYFYNHRVSNDPWPVWTGSKHGDEIQILFGLPLQYPKMFKSEEVKFSNDVIRYWMNFVRTG